MTIPRLLDEVVLTADVPRDPRFQGLRIVRVQNDEAALRRWRASGYQFQDPTEAYTRLTATLSRKGNTSGHRYRVVATAHPTLQTLVDTVRYDPSNPPTDDYHALGMQEMHDRTQSDFKGQKATNKKAFEDYLLEGVGDNRTLYLPTISGWQSAAVFDQTVFVALDESDADVLYGHLYLPRSPIMQADGQTQTAALFAVSRLKDALDAGALRSIRLTLEIELNVDVRNAGQSFADRNGRGSKKDKNLVISLDTSSALSELRARAVEGTVFEHRVATGRGAGTSELATENIVDLSTMEQMLLNVVSAGRHKPEQFKHAYVETFLPHAREFVQMLDDLFAAQWQHPTPPNRDPFRRLYVHGWPFALKALALCYHRARIDVLGPAARAIGARNAGRTVEEAYLGQLAVEREAWTEAPELTVDELRARLAEIDWHRYRAHWVALTGLKLGRDGSKRTVRLRGTGEVKVLGQAQNTAGAIALVVNSILSDRWRELTATRDEPVTEPAPAARR